MLRLNDKYVNKVSLVKNSHQIVNFTHYKSYSLEKGYKWAPQPKNLQYSLLFPKKFYRYWK